MGKRQYRVASDEEGPCLQEKCRALSVLQALDAVR